MTYRFLVRPANARSFDMMSKDPSAKFPITHGTNYPSTLPVILAKEYAQSGV